MKRIAEQMQAFCPWQECHDENSGYSYYWNMTTNEVTWEMPADYRLALQKWQLLQQQQSVDKKTGNASSQMSTSFVTEKLEAGKNKLSRNHKDSTSVKKKYPFESDSEEDEKIELITSYGSDSSDNSDNENSSQSKAESKNSNEKSSESKLKTPRILKPLSESDSKSTNTNAYGPCFPPDGSLNSFSAPKTNEISHGKKAKSVSLVPYGDASDVTNSDESFMSNSNSSRLIESINSTEDSKMSKSEPIASENRTIEDEDDEGESDDEDFDEDESLILSKLRSQAMVLKNLGGEIPDEIKCLIDSENPDIGIDDIIALIENETPPDHTMLTDSEKSPLKQESEAKNEIKSVEEKISSPNLVSEKDSTNEQATTNKPSSFALIAGYGDDSDQEESSPPKSGGTVISKRKALFPIDEKQNKSRNASKPELSSKPAFKKIKLSARAKALINASIITAKARATPSINVNEKNSSDIKPDSSVCLTSPSEDKSVEPVPVKDPIASDGKEFSDTIEKIKEEASSLLSEKVEQPEKKKAGELPKHNTQKLGVLSFNGPTASQLSSQVKPSAASTFAADLKPVSSDLETSSVQSNSYTSVWDTATTYAAEEKRGLGFCDDTKSSSASSFSFYRSKSEKKETGIQFVKAETINVNLSPPATSISEIGKEDDVSKSEIESISEVIVEKVKFLSEGKEPVSPVQIMTIQVEVDSNVAPVNADTLQALPVITKSSPALITKADCSEENNRAHPSLLALRDISVRNNKISCEKPAKVMKKSGKESGLKIAPVKVKSTPAKFLPSSILKTATSKQAVIQPHLLTSSIWKQAKTKDANCKTFKVAGKSKETRDLTKRRSNTPLKVDTLSTQRNFSKVSNTLISKPACLKDIKRTRELHFWPDSSLKQRTQIKDLVKEMFEAKGNSEKTLKSSEVQSFNWCGLTTQPTPAKFSEDMNFVRPYLLPSLSLKKNDSFGQVMANYEQMISSSELSQGMNLFVTQVSSPSISNTVSLRDTNYVRPLLLPTPVLRQRKNNDTEGFVRPPLLPTPVLRQKKINDTEEKALEVLKNVGEKFDSSKPEDCFSVFGKHIAYKLRNVTPEQNRLAQKLIIDILYEADMGSLNQDYCLHFRSLNRFKNKSPFVKKQNEQNSNVDENTMNVMTGRDEFESSKLEDSLDAFGKHIAYKLRVLSSEQNKFAEKLINDTVFEAELESLSNESRLHFPSFSQLPPQRFPTQRMRSLSQTYKQTRVHNRFVRTEMYRQQVFHSSPSLKHGDLKQEFHASQYSALKAEGARVWRSRRRSQDRWGPHAF